MRDQGRLVEWFDEQGYGFIQPNDPEKAPVFLHIKDFAKRGPRPIVGCALDYAVVVDAKGRFRATQVAYLKKKLVNSTFTTKNRTASAKTSSKVGLIPILILVYLVILVTAFWSKRISDISFYLIIAINVFTYVLYFKDKNAAQNNQWRVQEQSLHLLSALGGWPAAWFAQQKMRHKTQKKSFQNIYLCTIVLNISVMMWLIFYIAK